MRDDLARFIDHLGLVRPVLIGHSMGGTVAYLRHLNAPDPAWGAELSKLRVPLLLIGGGSTSPIPQDKLAEVAARVPSGRLVTLDGAGHSVHRTRPAEVVALVREFLIEQST